MIATDNRKTAYQVAILAAAALLLVPVSARARAAEKPGHPAASAVTWSPHAWWPGRHVTLGPTGAQGWISGGRIYVENVAKGSPGDGLLRKGDIITGVNGKRFRDGVDPRITLGAAITESETVAGGGRLALLVQRDGRSSTVNVRLPVMGSYSATWPYNCAKSARILKAACARLADAQYPDGHVPCELGMATMWAGPLFLASGEPEYLDNARRAAYWLIEQSYDGVTLNTWPAGYSGLFLAEYYLATGDRTVLPHLRKLTDLLVKGQMRCGSWGHSAPWGAYGAVNQTGLVCVISLVLTKECGLDVDGPALKRSLDFFRGYVGKGWIPYGDHRPWLGRSGNGKNALGAVLFNLVGREPEATRYFSRTVAASYRYREEGHTGCYFSMFWGPPAAVLAGDKEFRTFMDYQKWYYDLARRHDGGIVCQPNEENLGGRTPGGYTWGGGAYTTGGMALFYAMPLKRLRVLGGGRSVFGRRLPAPLDRARTLYEQRKWDELSAALAKLAKTASGSPEQRRMAKRLAAAAEMQRKSVDLTLLAIENSIREQDPYRASELLKSLERLLGKDDPALSDAQDLVEKNKQWVETGQKYYETWSKLRELGEEYWHTYGRRTRAMLGATGPAAPKRWTVLVATSDKTPQTWKAFQWGDLKDDSPPDDPMPAATKGWNTRGFDDSKWTSAAGPIRPKSGGKDIWSARHLLLRRTFDLSDGACTRLRIRLAAGRDCPTDVYLNGVLVLRAVRGPTRKFAVIELAGASVRLLRKGANLLAVHCRRSAGGRAGNLDVGLEAVTPAKP